MNHINRQHKINALYDLMKLIDKIRIERNYDVYEWYVEESDLWLDRHVDGWRLDDENFE